MSRREAQVLKCFGDFRGLRPRWQPTDYSLHFLLVLQAEGVESNFHGGQLSLGNPETIDSLA